MGFTLIHLFGWLCCCYSSVLFVCLSLCEGSSLNRWEPLLSQIPLVLHPAGPAQVALWGLGLFVLPGVCCFSVFSHFVLKEPETSRS